MFQRQATTAQPSQAAKTLASTSAPALADLRRLPVWSLGVETAPQPSLTALPVQRKLMVGRPDDPSEQEADRVAEQVTTARGGADRMRMSPPGANDVQPANGGPRVQRRCAACDHDEDDESNVLRLKGSEQDALVTSADESVSIQRREGDLASPQGLSAPVERQITSLSGGQPLPPSVRDFFEPRFGYDFSHVRVHTDESAAQSAQSISALAYTTGHRIVFNRGQFAPHSEPGKRLLAHELTHVIQQNPSVGRMPISPQFVDKTPAGAEKAVDPVDTPRVQRKPFFLAPVNKPSGTRVHNEVLPLFVEENKDLFIEAPIPGATKTDVDKGAKGRADFYKAEPPRTIGIKFEDDEPAKLSGSQVQWGGGKYNHNSQSAPQGASTSPRVRRVSEAPLSIQIGDLKPGFSSETFLGQGQVDNYIAGIQNTAAALRTYLANNPGEGPAAGAWTPTAKAMTSLAIPGKVTYPSGSAFPAVPLALYEEAFPKVRKVLDDTGLRGRLFVYKDKVAGVWSYEWIPEAIPATTGSGLVNTVLNWLNSDVIPSITAVSSQPGSVQRKDLPGRIGPVRQKVRGPAVQRAEKKFDAAQWKKTHYEPWKDEAEKFLASKEDVTKATVAESLVDLEERSQLNIGIPTDVKQRGKGLDKIKHWKRFGGLYGWVREKFDFVYVKLKGFVDRIKAKMKRLTKSSAGVKFSNWVKAAARVIFKIFKLVGSWVVRETVDQLLNSLRQGIANNLKKLVDAFTPEGVKSKIEEFEDLKEQYEKVVGEKEEELERLFFGDKLDLFEKISEFEAEAEKYSTIVSLVEWGIRLLACASPPAIGCLWNLVISALQAAFALLIQTCWFTKKVYAPIISEVDLVKKFPTRLAGEVVTFANSYIPMPAGLDPLFAPITVDMAQFNVDCEEAGDSGSPTSPEREAIMDLIAEIGTEKFNALLELMLKRGAGPWVLLTADRVAALKEQLKNVSTEDLQALTKDPSKGAPESLDKLLADIAKYTPREKETARKFFADKAKQEAAKAAAAKGGEAEAQSAGTSTKGGGKPGEAGAAGVTVLQGKDHTIKGPVSGKPASNVTARVVDASWQHAKEKPDIISVNIFVDGTHRYRVENVRVRDVFGAELLAVPSNVVEVIYYLQDGLQINIDGVDYFWKQLTWAKSKADMEPQKPQ